MIHLHLNTSLQYKTKLRLFFHLFYGAIKMLGNFFKLGTESAEFSANLSVLIVNLNLIVVSSAGQMIINSRN